MCVCVRGYMSDIGRLFAQIFEKKLFSTFCFQRISTCSGDVHVISSPSCEKAPAVLSSSTVASHQQGKGVETQDQLVCMRQVSFSLC